MTSNYEKMTANRLETIQSQTDELLQLEAEWITKAKEQDLVNKAILIAYTMGQETKRKYYRFPWQEYGQGKLLISVVKKASDWDTSENKFHPSKCRDRIFQRARKSL